MSRRSTKQRRAARRRNAEYGRHAWVAWARRAELSWGFVMAFVRFVNDRHGRYEVTP